MMSEPEVGGMRQEDYSKDWEMIIFELLSFLNDNNAICQVCLAGICYSLFPKNLIASFELLSFLMFSFMWVANSPLYRRLSFTPRA